MTVDGEARLADGRTVLLRPAGPDDAGVIARLYLDLSPDSLWRRFHCSRPAPPLVTRFAGLGAGSACIVAAPLATPDRLAAEARYVPIDAETAELALTVRDDYQGTGLGHLLLDALVQRAREAGLLRLRGEVLPGNIPMLRLLQRYGCAAIAPAEGSSEICLEISAIGGMPGWPANSAGRRVLVEQRGRLGGARAKALRSAGNDVRQCTGPLRKDGLGCPLVTSGECRLAAEADLIISLLPADDPDCAAVLAAHRQRWPHLLAR